MTPKKIHSATRLATIVFTIAGATFGSLVGVASSMWGGIFVIVPVTTGIFGIVGALIGGALEFAARMKWPPDFEI